MSKHTKGPWLVKTGPDNQGKKQNACWEVQQDTWGSDEDDDDYEGKYSTTGHIEIGPADHFAIACAVHGWESYGDSKEDDDHRANARLIAAAPELYALVLKYAESGDLDAEAIIERIGNEWFHNSR